MVFFDKFDESNFNIDNQELDVQAVTVSELKREYSELGTLRFWPLGEQAARKDGTIIYRSYKTLSFSNNAIDFDFVDLGYEDPTTQDRYQWRVIHEFVETERYSSSDLEFGNFKVWEVSNNDFQMEITYDNNITILDDKGNFDSDDDDLAVFTWDRPIETITTLGIGCPANPTIADPGFTLPGDWVLVQQASVNNPDTICERYVALEKSFYLVYDVGKSLGAEITSDLTPSNIYISNRPDLTGTFKVPNGSGVESSPYQLEFRYLIIEWLDPGKDDLTTATVTLRGNEAYRVFSPITKDLDPECPEHDDTVPYIAHAPIGTPTRYKPPGEYTFPDNFWNDTVDTTIEGFLDRLNAQPSQIS